MDILNRYHNYNIWANGLLLKAFEQHGENMPYQCLHLLSHIFNAQCVWLSRINYEKPGVTIWQDHDFATCKKMYEETSAGFGKVLESYDPQTIIGYANSLGDIFETSMFDIVFHTFNHGTYHRAQIAAEMKRNGLDPVNTDYIKFIRQF